MQRVLSDNVQLNKCVNSHEPPSIAFHPQLGSHTEIPGANILQSHHCLLSDVGGWSPNTLLSLCGDDSYSRLACSFTRGNPVATARLLGSTGWRTVLQLFRWQHTRLLVHSWNSSDHSSISGPDRVKDPFAVFTMTFIQTWVSPLTNARVDFVCTARNKTIVHDKDPISSVRQVKAWSPGGRPFWSSSESTLVQTHHSPLTNACVDFVCTARSKTIVHDKNPNSSVRQEKAWSLSHTMLCNPWLWQPAVSYALDPRVAHSVIKPHGA